MIIYGSRFAFLHILLPDIYETTQGSTAIYYSWCALFLLVGPKNRSGCAWLRTSLFPWCSTKRFGAVQCALLGLPRQQQASAESRGPATPVHDNAFLPAKPTCIHDRLWLFIRLFIKFSPDDEAETWLQTALQSPWLSSRRRVAWPSPVCLNTSPMTHSGSCCRFFA